MNRFHAVCPTFISLCYGRPSPYLSCVVQFLRKFETPIWRRMHCPCFAHDKCIQVRLRSCVALAINQIASVPESVPRKITLEITILGTYGSN